MNIARISAHALHIPFKVAFAHAAATRATTQSILVTAMSTDGAIGIGEGCPREYVTQESVATALAFVARHCRDWQTAIRDVPTLTRWMQRHNDDIDAQPAAWAAAELALLDLIGHTQGRPMESLLGLPLLSGSFRYTAVLGDAAPKRFAAQLAAYRQAGFRDYKIKLSGEFVRDQAKVQALLASGLGGGDVRADANNLWTNADEAIEYLNALGFAFRGLEEPLQVADFSGMRRVANALGAAIILDESLLRTSQLDAIGIDTTQWIANVRVSKMGGLLRSLQFMAKAREAGVPIIVGAHVGETSILTRAGLTLAHALRGQVIACEGAFGTHLLEHDIVAPSLRFGAGGMFTTSETGAAPGLGLVPVPSECGREEALG